MSVKIIISGGGTGGHIFPAIAIANAIKVLNEDAEILFVGAEGRMEMEKVPASGYKIEGLWISGLQRRLTVDNLSFPLKVISSVLKARKIIKRFKPDAVVGVGGYASGPLLYAAARNRIPTLIQEQNSFPGITNKLLAGRVRKICVAYDGMERFFPAYKLLKTGNPVRQDILNLEGKRAIAFEEFGLDNTKKTILVIGGSLGARTINESIAQGLAEFTKDDVQVLWQTGKGYIEQAEQALAENKYPGIKASAFITRMDYAYAVADIVISRAGASSVSELCVVKKPSILVPSPNVAEDHQTKNAMALVDKNAAILIKDAKARQDLVKTALQLIHNEKEQKELSENIAELGITDAAQVIAAEILAMCKPKI
jgi:UDP-N-acetylglucosamine--N-acetylmuramyl-(pentapeptide) pyrophosphoryl-undecaprenol N-acetylglucosamine transferase